jgi:cytochrome c553
MVGSFALLVLMFMFSGASRAADGKEIAADGNGRDVPACSACHGEQGEGRPDAGYPRLAGLNCEYLVEQLKAFAEGRRDNETMHPIAKALVPEERQAIAKFYAELMTPAIAQPKQADDKTIAV